MLLQANIDLGLESTTAAQNYSTTQINKQKAKNPFSYFCVSFVCNIIWDHFPRLYANKKQQKYCNKIGSDLLSDGTNMSCGNPILKMTTFSRSEHIATWKMETELFWAKCISWMLTNKKVMWFLSFKKCHLVANDFGGIQFF